MQKREVTNAIIYDVIAAKLARITMQANYTQYNIAHDAYNDIMRMWIFISNI